MNVMGTKEPKLIFPALGGFYAAVADLWYPMIRVTAGAVLLTHGWAKVHSGVAAVAATFVKNGFPAPGAFADVTILLETAGAACIVLGLFTRVVAAVLAVEMAIITFAVMVPQGWGRVEFPLMWGIVMFAIALRGGGPYSLDRVIGREI
jgi:putative oxidoreductase